MAFIQTSFYSQEIARVTSFLAVIPNDQAPAWIENNPNYKRPMKSLYLLHGYTASQWEWLLNSKVQDLALKYNIAIIMPSGDNHFYVDGKGTGNKYGRYTGIELVNYTRKLFGLSDRKEDTFIGGLSMGGFGAIRTGIKYSNTFGKLFALSSALIVNGIMNMPEGSSNEVADYDYYSYVFGNLDKLKESENNPEYLLRLKKRNNEVIPGIYMACGTEDFLLNPNREFYEFLKSEQVEATYMESTGNHNFDFWNQYLEPAMTWLLEH